ncbi:tetracycline resistance transcriptional repressor TetR [Paraburkholderia hospita]|uniref:TetR family transcriptional regulator n=1 Tax=Paraburkholderia hospita TaxID=169430 RepID=A0AAJ4VVH3_9BURK|nr:tetracycline resistance transcriptional repressor TetR [Paraburkholderia hospita]AUT71589.1 TetR family transcriptional regulator [Paraburkholderia hospita]AXF02544.1 TetR family transcriptional regulator [Paraburkholderia hospita]EIM97336.1 tetracycline repressor protein [Paraburkholderia hospita]OUL73137.1 TetR family transcriptional regulator [Paraburkholderia hospita]OUL73307.1 TetR family transcriptional regulator [Paraburkholderia hospita]
MAKLDREAVVGTALELLNEVGVDGLTTRKLADRLGVQQPALYWHFRNKRALLDALAEAMLAQTHRRSLPVQGEDWRAFLKANALSFRKALLAYRDGARIHAGTRPAPSQFSVAEAQIRFLCDAGFSPKDALRALVAISHYVVGSALEHQASEPDLTERQDAAMPHASTPSAFLQDVFDALKGDGLDAAFDYGLDCLIAGLEQKLLTAQRL